MTLRKVGIIGCGIMGGDIAQICAQSGYETIVYTVRQKSLDNALAHIDCAWNLMANKHRITAEQCCENHRRLHGTLDIEQLADCDIIVESIVEHLEDKLRLFVELDHILAPEAILLTNTSSLSVTQLGAATSRPDRVCGLHFFNPATTMKLVEIVQTISTSEETIETVKQFALSLGKKPVIAKDTAGFIVNALLVPYVLSAVRMLEHGRASRDDIDLAMKLGCGHPMGPLTLIDFSGLDTTLWIAEALYEEYKDPIYAPPPLLRRMVHSGMLGRKSGKGFYEY